MRVLVFGAGRPAGVNVCRSLAEAGHSVVGADANPAHLPWAAVYCDEVIHMLRPSVESVNAVVADALHAQSEQVVQWIADHRDKLDAATLCPSSQAIALTQDKWEAGLMFRRAGLRSDYMHLIQDPHGVQHAYRNLGFPFWLRARYGAGAKGSALCENVAQAESWSQYWWARDPKIDFLAEAYLPGRDLAWTSLWWKGMLIASFGRERLEYIYPNLAPSGRTGTPTIARTVHEHQLNSTAFNTVLAIDSAPHGFYSVDLREDGQGVPRPTEVKAGRCFTTSYLSTAAGLNFMDLWCQLIRPIKWRVAIPPPRTPEPVNSIPAGLTWMRHIDCPELLLDEHGQIYNERNRDIPMALATSAYPPDYME